MFKTLFIPILAVLATINSCKTPVPQKVDIDKPLVFQDLFNAASNPDVACYRIPAIITAPNGDLIATIDERVPGCGDLKFSKDINIVQRRSTDNGKTWSDIETVVNLPLGQSASDPSMIVDETTGEIILFYNFMDLDKAKDVYFLYVTKSADNGKTWGTPEYITSQITTPAWDKDFKFITSGRGIQTRDGKLLHCMVNLNKGMHLFGSDDHGKTWKLYDTVIKPADESKVIELNDGTWMVNARINNKEGVRYVHTSKDEGKTWQTKPEPALTDPGCNASIIRYTSVKDGFDKDRLLFSNANSANNRMNMTVKISYDEGKTWSEGKTIYAGSSAYSDMTVMENGDIGLFFEKDNYSENVFTSFSLEWLTNGQDSYKKAKKK